MSPKSHRMSSRTRRSSVLGLEFEPLPNALTSKAQAGGGEKRADPYDPYGERDSWSNHFVRTALGTNEVRKACVEHVVREASMTASASVPDWNTLDAYPDYSGSKADYDERCTKVASTFLDAVIASSRTRYVVCFLTQWQQSAGDTGTHFVGVVVDRLKRSATIFDPAVGADQDATSDAKYYFDLRRVQAFLNSRGYATAYDRSEATIQLSTGVEDIYCQSWSLYMVARYVRLELGGLPPGGGFPERLPGDVAKYKRWRELAYACGTEDCYEPQLLLKNGLRSKSVREYVRYASKQSKTRREASSMAAIHFNATERQEYDEYEKRIADAKRTKEEFVLLSQQLADDVSAKFLLIYGFMSDMLRIPLVGLRVRSEVLRHSVAEGAPTPRFDAVAAFLGPKDALTLMQLPQD